MSIDYGSLAVDKENEFVQYNDEVHKYWTKDTQQNCISVTTLIHQFTTFDEEFWSSYKTLEKMLSEEDFKSIKGDLTKIKTMSVIETKKKLFDINEDEFQENRKILLKEWEDKREASCVRGTAIHREHELAHLAGNTKELQHLGLGGKFTTNTTNKIELGARGIYPELLLSRISDDGLLRIAGQADLIIIDGMDVYVLDYKSNRSIDKKSFFDARTKKSSKMKYPLNNIDDCNFMHYSLQLSTYAWMIQQINPNFNIKLLMLIHYDHDGGCTTYECDYLKDDVERMLKWYKKEVSYTEFKKKKEKIQF